MSVFGNIGSMGIIKSLLGVDFQCTILNFGLINEGRIFKNLICQLTILLPYTASGHKATGYRFVGVEIDIS